MINVVSITDLKQNTKQVVEKVKTSKKPMVVLQRSEPAAVLVDPEYYEKLEQALEDLEDLQAIEERKNEPTVSFEEVAKKIGYKLK
ncbi:type II toxin-antitoxin system Phd/YefM family antitoxin [Candidatus Daviesbacteria bacterium]|nr:type II toxin-antitoxin system Phd/YefM family antitoxin [Candidatus Daviesbacteria bacterium]